MRDAICDIFHKYDIIIANLFTGEMLFVRRPANYITLGENRSRLQQGGCEEPYAPMFMKSAHCCEVQATYLVFSYRIVTRRIVSLAAI